MQLLILGLLMALAGAEALRFPFLRSQLQTAGRKADVMIVTMGSRGDIVPMVNVCEALMPQINSCTVVTQAAHSDLVEKRGFRFMALTDPDSEVAQSISLASFYGFASAEAFRWMLSSDFKARFNANYHAIEQHVASAKPDVVLMNPWLFVQPLIRAKFNVPVVTINPFPWKFMEGVPNFAESMYEKLMGGHGPTRVYNATVSVHNYMSKAVIKNHVRKLLKPLAANLTLSGKDLTRDLFETPHIYGYSRHLLARSFLADTETYVTGTWAQSASIAAPAPAPGTAQGDQWLRMQDFIRTGAAQGRKHIFMGFGSMEYSTPFWATVTNRLKDVLRDFPDVAVIYQGPNNGMARADLPELPRVVAKNHTQEQELLAAYQRDEVWAHPRLFRMTGPMSHNLFMPHIEAFVTHGGAGSIATATTFGVPMIIKPFFGDQFVWCNEIESHNWGSCLSRQFGKTELEASLKKVFGNKEMQESVRALHAKIKTEDGLGNFKLALGAILKGYLGRAEAPATTAKDGGGGSEAAASRAATLRELQRSLLPPTAVMEKSANTIFVRARAMRPLGGLLGNLFRSRSF